MATQQRIGTHATTVRRTDGVLSVVYHGTEVVRQDANGITLDSGGWRTVTTKTRMNQASNQYGLGYLVYSSGRVWYVRTRAGDVAFHDRMVLNG